MAANAEQQLTDLLEAEHARVGRALATVKARLTQGELQSVAEVLLANADLADTGDEPSGAGWLRQVANDLVGSPLTDEKSHAQ